MHEMFLTSRQNEIFNLILQGKTNKDIRQTLHLSKNTVKTHIKNVLEKFESKSQKELISKYYKKERG